MQRLALAISALAFCGTEVIASSPQEFAASMRAERASLEKVIKAAGIRTE